MVLDWKIAESVVACQTCAWWAAKEYKAIEATRQVAAGIGALK